MTPTDERRARALDPRAFENAPELSKEDAGRRRRIALAEARMRRKFDESIDLATYDTRTHVAVSLAGIRRVYGDNVKGWLTALEGDGK